MLRRLVVVLHWPAFLLSLFLIGFLIFGLMIGEDIGDLEGLFWLILPTFFTTQYFGTYYSMSGYGFLGVGGDRSCGNT